MSTLSPHTIAQTDWVSSMVLEPPPDARDHPFPCRATLIALARLSHTRELPVLSAWGKTARDAQEHREGEMRAWLASGLPPPPGHPPPLVTPTEGDDYLWEELTHYATTATARTGRACVPTPCHGGSVAPCHPCGHPAVYHPE